MKPKQKHSKLTGKRKARSAKSLFDREFAGGLPVFDSMDQCAAQTYIPASIQRAAKKKGCDGFKSNRVYLRPLLKWIFSANKEDRTDWRGYFEKFNALIRELDYQNKSGETLNKTDVQLTVSKVNAMFFNQLDRLVNVELPPDLKGRDERQCQERLLRGMEDLKRAFVSGLAELGALNK